MSRRCSVRDFLLTIIARYLVECCSSLCYAARYHRQTGCLSIGPVTISNEDYVGQLFSSSSVEGVYKLDDTFNHRLDSTDFQETL